MILNDEIHEEIEMNYVKNVIEMIDELKRLGIDIEFIGDYDVMEESSGESASESLCAHQTEIY